MVILSGQLTLFFSRARPMKAQPIGAVTRLRDIQHAHDSIPQRRDLVYIDELP